MPLGQGKGMREFNPGPPTSSPRRLNFYGHFRRGHAAQVRRLRGGTQPIEGGGLFRFVMNMLRVRAAHMRHLTQNRKEN